MSGLHLTADIKIIKFKILVVRPNDLLESELKPLYTNRMPGILLSTSILRMPRDFPSLQSLSILKGSKKKM